MCELEPTLEEVAKRPNAPVQILVLVASELAAGMDHDEAAAADRWRKANLLSGAIARAAKSNKPLVISDLQASHHQTLQTLAFFVSSASFNGRLPSLLLC